MKKILSIILALTIVLSSVSVFATEVETTATEKTAITFSDVDANSSVGNAIYKLVNAGVLNGYTDGTFRPDNSITRAELCKIINIAFKYTEAATDVFSDVKEDDWFRNEVAIAKKAGYITGHDDGTFKGNDNLTREEACAIITRVAELYDLTMTETITDAVSDWAVPYVNKVVANRLMSLEEGGKFRATEKITRAELVDVVANFVVVTPEEPKTEEEEKPSTDDKKPSAGSTGGGSSGGSGSSGSGVSQAEINKLSAKLETLEGKVETYKAQIRPGSDEDKILDIALDIIESVIQDGKDGKKIYEEDYVLDNYSEKVESAKDLYDGLDDKTNFYSTLLNAVGKNDADELLKLMFGMSLEDVESQIQ